MMDLLVQLIKAGKRNELVPGTRSTYAANADALGNS